MIKGVLKILPTGQITVPKRFRINYKDMASFKESIKQDGLLNPITVEDVGDSTYLLTAGGRRLRACMELEMEEITCNVYPKMSELERRTIELVENLFREDLDYSEKAALTREIHKLQVALYGPKYGTSKEGHSMRDTAILLKRSHAIVAQDIELANMIDAVPELAYCKNKAEALKFMDKAKREVEKEKQAIAYEDSVASLGKDKRRQELFESFIIGDFTKQSEKIANKSANLIEFDPPYAIRLNKIKKSGTLAMARYKEIEPDKYVETLTESAKEFYRILTPNGWLIMWFSIRFWFEETAVALEKAGFQVNRLPCIWAKGIVGQTQQPNYQLPSSYDAFFYARKGSAELVKRGRSNMFGFPVVSSSKKEHAIERPIELYQEILETFTMPNSICYSPCLGSGTIILAASNANMRCFGYDLSEDSRNAFIVNVNEGVPGHYSSYE